jgi:hypothetical protein
MFKATFLILDEVRHRMNKNNKQIILKRKSIELNKMIYLIRKKKKKDEILKRVKNLRVNNLKEKSFEILKAYKLIQIK